MTRIKVEGIDYSPKGIDAVREDLIRVRGEAMSQWPESIPFTILVTHVIALLADYREMRQNENRDEKLDGDKSKTVSS